MQLGTFIEDGMCNYGFVQGVFVEVLWDIEVSKCDGRRVGERLVESTWWRAEVMKVERTCGKFKAQLRYEGRDGFKEQLGDLWVFPRHIRIVEDDSTQLRWRFFECSGEVSYDQEDDRVSLLENKDGGCLCHGGRVKALQEQVGMVLHQYETIESMIVAQNIILNRLVGAGSTGDRQ